MRLQASIAALNPKTMTPVTEISLWLDEAVVSRCHVKQVRRPAAVSDALILRRQNTPTSRAARNFVVIFTNFTKASQAPTIYVFGAVIKPYTRAKHGSPGSVSFL
jgi:hypothetical protein